MSTPPRPFDYNNLPEPIKRRGRFLVGKLVQKSDGKLGKIPHYATTGKKRQGLQGSPDDLANLVSFEEANALYLSDPQWDFIGIALIEGDGIAVLDADHYLDQGSPVEGHVAHTFIEEAERAGCWTEISISETGVHAFGDPDALANWKQERDGGKAEYYVRNQFIALTARCYSNPGKWGKLAACKPTENERQTRPNDGDDDEGPIITPKAIAELRDALQNNIESDDRELWIRLGLALKTLPGDKGRALWMDWSRKSPKFDAADADEKWAGFRPTHTSHEVVFQEAQDNWGWINPAKRTRPASTGTSPLPLEWAGDITPKLDSLWLIKKTLPENGLALIFGHPGCGKTFLALDMACHIALGWDWHGRKVRKGTVVYVAAEGQNGLRNRVAAFREHHADRINGATFPLAVIPQSLDLHDPKADREALADAIRAAADQTGEPPALITVDTLSKTLGGGKENTDDLATYLTNCAWLASKFGCCVLLVHHRPKNQESTDPRGHSSLKGGLDTVILVEANGPIKSAKITKQRDDEERDLLAFRLNTHALGIDSDGEEVTSCTIEAVDPELAPATPIERAASRLTANNRLVWRKFLELLDQEPEPVPATIPVDELDDMSIRAVVSVKAWRDKVVSAFGTEAGQNPDTGRRAFDRAKVGLQNLGFLRVYGDFAWQVGRSFRTEDGQ